MILVPVTVGADSLSDRHRFGVNLIGTKNTINDTFTTPDFFVHETDNTIRPFIGGRRLKYGQDFLVDESGGPGTGFDTIILQFPSGKRPKSTDALYADYIISA